MIFVIILGSLVSYVLMSFVVTWLWATHYLPIHPKGSCGRIGCNVGYPRLYDHKASLESCVKTKSIFWGVLWPIGIFVFGLHMSSQGGFNNYLNREKELKAKAELVKKLEAEEAEKQRKIDKIIKELRAESKSKGVGLSSEENWMREFYELESK